MITTLIEFGTPAYDEAVHLRDKILRKPLGLEFTPKQLEEEYTDYHLACYSDQFKIIGILVLTPKKEGYIKMRQVAIQEHLQRSGIGSKLVYASEQFACALGFKVMELNARDVAIPFYEKLNYHKVGDEFEEVSIKHFRMEKSL